MKHYLLHKVFTDSHHLVVALIDAPTMIGSRSSYALAAALMKPSGKTYLPVAELYFKGALNHDSFGIFFDTVHLTGAMPVIEGVNFIPNVTFVDSTFAANSTIEVHDTPQNGIMLKFESREPCSENF